MTLTKFDGDINSQLQHKDNKMIGHKSFADATRTGENFL